MATKDREFYRVTLGCAAFGKGLRRINTLLVVGTIRLGANRRAWLPRRAIQGIKPGGSLGIVDHQAVSGSPAETGSTLHRIDSAIVIADLEGAGFVLDGKSNVLANAEDDHSKGVFDPSVRGKTDRYVLRFKKPE
jgi:predicted methyltransferase